MKLALGLVALSCTGRASWPIIFENVLHFILFFFISFLLTNHHMKMKFGVNLYSRLSNKSLPKI